MSQDLSIRVSTCHKSIYFITNVAGSVGTGLVASRLFKSFSAVHGAGMGVFCGIGLTIASINRAYMKELILLKENAETSAPAEGMLIGLGCAAFLPLLMNFFKFKTDVKILSQFLGAHIGGMLFINLITSTLVYKNPIELFNINS